MASGDGLQGRTGLLKGVRDSTQRVRADLKVKVMTDAWDISDAGAAAVSYRIMNVQSAIAPGKDNRVLSGNMLKSVDNYAEQKGNVTTARAGWIDKKERYFAIQDQGGIGYGAFEGVEIWPMEALIFAKQTMKEVAKKKGYEIV